MRTCFARCRRRAYSVRVGLATTAARYYLSNHTAVRRVLRELSQAPRERGSRPVSPGCAVPGLAPTRAARDRDRHARSPPQSRRTGPDPFWYKSGVIYEVHVRSFHDGNGDGCGDFPGLTEKLDYLKDLGVTAVWLLPFYPSPLKDDGYDIADYCDVHPQYGTLRDFQVFLREAHRRGLRVITELVLEPHLGSAPVVSARAAGAARQPVAKFYIWSNTPDRYKEARIIFKDVETSNWTWDHVAGAYYWHRFFSHQPDLNYENPEVHRGDDPEWWISGSTWAWTGCGWTRCPTSTSRTAPTARTCRRRMPS